MYKRQARGKDVILDIERQGAVQVCAKRPETVRIFIAPPSWDELERRLTARGTDTPEKIQKRLIRAQVDVYKRQPLAHRTAGTLETGTVRCSFSAFSTTAQVEHFARILRQIVR